MNLGKENEHTEHKRSTSELKEGMESVTSILNKRGPGTLYVGVRPKDGEVVGQDVSEKTLRDISQAFTNSIEPRVIPIIECLTTEDGRDYIKVTFAGDERPYACDGRYRIRSADEDILMGQSALRALMRDERYRKSPWDREASDRPLSDVDEDELRAFVERGRAKMRIAFEHRSVEDALSRLHLLAGDRLTNAADALFCPSVGVQLKMGVFKTHARTEALDIRQESGTIFHLVDQAEYFIANNIRRRFVVDGERMPRRCRRYRSPPSARRSSTLTRTARGTGPAMCRWIYTTMPWTSSAPAGSSTAKILTTTSWARPRTPPPETSPSRRPSSVRATSSRRAWVSRRSRSSATRRACA